MTTNKKLKRILITGATGFVGNNLIHKIDPRIYKIALIVRTARRRSASLKKRFRCIEYKSGSKKFIKQITTFNPEIVLHLASYLSSKHDSITLGRLLDSNIQFGSYVLDALRQTQVKYFINTGSFSEYYKKNVHLDPAYLYSATKTAFRSLLDFYAKLIGFKTIQVTPYTIYGPGDTKNNVVRYIAKSLGNSKPIPMTKGNQVLDFIYITDVVDFYCKLLQSVHKIKKQHTEFYLGTGVGATLKHVAEVAEKISGKKANIHWGAIPYRPRDVMHAVAPRRRISSIIQWKAKITITHGLASVLTKETSSS